MTAQKVGAHTIPLVEYCARSGTTTDLTYPIPKGYVPTPFIHHHIDPNIGIPHIRPPKTTQNPIAPPQSTVTAPQTGRLLIGFLPDPIWQNFKEDFFLPLDIPMEFPVEISQQHRASQSSQATQPSQSQSSQPSQHFPTHNHYFPPKTNHPDPYFHYSQT